MGMIDIVFFTCSKCKFEVEVEVNHDGGEHITFHIEDIIPEIADILDSTFVTCDACGTEHILRMNLLTRYGMTAEPSV